MKMAFSKRQELQTRKMNKVVKKKIVKTEMWSVGLYSAEACSLRNIRGIEALKCGYGERWSLLAPKFRQGTGRHGGGTIN